MDWNWVSRLKIQFLDWNIEFLTRKMAFLALKRDENPFFGFKSRISSSKFQFWIENRLSRLKFSHWKPHFLIQKSGISRANFQLKTPLKNFSVKIGKIAILIEKAKGNWIFYNIFLNFSLKNIEMSIFSLSPSQWNNI